ncbi:MAG: sigma-70 family RNA polymerase sigma factor [Elusimicrobia bacterium]|nr:sigma-70 family RNA polymerase sigma factor [Elusimicrobiota bacterium]
MLRKISFLFLGEILITFLISGHAFSLNTTPKSPILTREVEVTRVGPSFSEALPPSFPAERTPPISLSSHQEVSRLVQDHQRLVQHIANSLIHKMPRRVEFTELLAEGNLAIVIAAQRYDPSRGVSFTTYAWPYIRGAMLQVRRSVNPLGRWSRNRLKYLRAIQQEFSGGEYPTIKELARRIEEKDGRAVSTEEIRHLLRIRSMKTVSLNQPIPTSLSFTRPRYPDAPTPSREEDTDNRIDVEKIIRWLSQPGKTVGPKEVSETRVLEMLYLEGRPPEEVASEIGVSVGYLYHLKSNFIQRAKQAIQEAERN